MRQLAAALGGIALLLVVVTSGLSATRAAAQDGTPVADAPLRFDVRFRDTILAAEDGALSLGDRVILSDVLLQAGEEVGHDSGVCTVTDVAGEMLCAVVFVLPEGTISTQFVNTPPPRKVFAVIGGTGHFAGARGTGELVESADQTGTVEFHLARWARCNLTPAGCHSEAREISSFGTGSPASASSSVP